jgi:vanillate O-demethylase ferredoxin subunit
MVSIAFQPLPARHKSSSLAQPPFAFAATFEMEGRLMPQVLVSRKSIVADGICSFELCLANGELLPAFTAGAHVDVHLPSGVVRQYSLCNAPQERHRYLIGVLKDPSSRGGSQAMHDWVEQGHTLHISEPRNLFPLAGEGTTHLLIAGGIGITPMLAMAHELEHRGADFELHYCFRSPDRAAFLDELVANA